MEKYFDCDIVTVRTLLRKVAFFLQGAMASLLASS